VADAAGISAQRSLRVVTGAESPSSRHMLQALKARWPTLVADINPDRIVEERKPPYIHIALGATALQKSLAAGLKGPVMAAMTSSQAYLQLLNSTGLTSTIAGQAKARPSSTAVFTDTAPSTQLQLIHAIFGKRTVVGCLLSDASAYLERPLRMAADQLGIELIVERVLLSTEPVRALTRLRDAQVLLAVPDNVLYTPDTLRAILESTYRKAMPVIGFSSATVTAGTLASTHCTVDDMVGDLFDLIDEFDDGPLPEPRFPKYWRVAINDSVARSLGIPIEDKVRQLGQQPGGKIT
jgi:ABC-type uncharacterized transport system substrate-binding protein